MRRRCETPCPVGRIAFTAGGMGVDRLLDRAAEQGIMFFNLIRQEDRLSGEIACRDLDRLREVVLQGGWRMKIQGTRGAAEAVRLMCQHKFLIVMSIVLLLAGVFASRLVWRVEVTDAGVYSADAGVYLTQLGIVPGVRRSSVDVQFLRNQLEWRYPDASWIECGWRGMTLQIRFHCGTPKGEALQISGSTDVIARDSGIVTQVITLAGTPLVSPGDYVYKGQVLIKGEERTKAGETTPVSARGKVFARVWESAQVLMPVTEVITTYSGRQEQSHTVVLPWFSLWQTPDPGFEQADIHVREMPLGGLYFPFVIRWETAHEGIFERRKIPHSILEARSGLAALQKLQMQCQNGVDFLTKWVDYSMIEDEILSAEATGERIIDIAAVSDP